MKSSKIFGAIMLVSCTTIGGGILALPLQTFVPGFIPTSINFIICWIFMTFAALYMLEASIDAKPHANLISIANQFLGTYGKIFAWITYLALLCALMCAFTASMSAWFTNFFNIPTITANIAVSLIFGGIIYAGNDSLNLVNKVFSIILFVSLFYIIALAFTKADLEIVKNYDVKSSILTIPLIITSFGFAIVIPSINNYLNFEVKKIKKVVLIGSFVPLIIYLLWEFSLLGSLHDQLMALSSKASDGTEVSRALSNKLNTKSITFFADLFSITSLVTSLLGVGLSLFDFLADGLKIKKSSTGKLLNCFIIFTPVVLLINVFPIGFGTILSFGGIFVAGLLGILPVIIVWQKRKTIKNNKYTTPGGNWLMLATITFFIGVIAIEIYNCLK